MLDFFKDLTFVFRKSCDGGKNKFIEPKIILFTFFLLINSNFSFSLEVDHISNSSSTLHSLLIWGFIITFIGCCVGTIVNHLIFKKQGFDMVPGLERLLNFAIRLKIIRDSVKNDQI